MTLRIARHGQLHYGDSVAFYGLLCARNIFLLEKKEGVFRFTRVQITPSTRADSCADTEFVVGVGNEREKFKAANEQDRDSWVNTINAVVRNEAPFSSNVLDFKNKSSRLVDPSGNTCDMSNENMLFLVENDKDRPTLRDVYQKNKEFCSRVELDDKEGFENMKKRGEQIAALKVQK